MKVLVTGAAGFIGSHVAEQLLKLGHDVVALDDLSGGYVDHVPSGAQFVQGSILDHDLLESLFEAHRFEVVFHLAAYAAEGLSHFIRRYNYSVNVIGSVNLINLAVRFNVRRFVFTSSIAVYGANQVPMHEALVPKPEDPYGIAKYAVEQDLEAARHMFGLEYVVFRPHNVYGEQQNLGDPYRNVIGIFMNRAMSRQSLPIFGDGTQTRAFSYIGDVAPLIAEAIDRPDIANQVFNIGAEEVYSVNELATQIEKLFPEHGGRSYQPARNEVQHAYANHGKLEEYFGKLPTTPLMTGLARMAAWARKTGVRSSKPFEHIEIERALPPSWRPAAVPRSLSA